MDHPTRQEQQEQQQQESSTSTCNYNTQNSKGFYLSDITKVRRRIKEKYTNIKQMKLRASMITSFLIIILFTIVAVLNSDSTTGSSTSTTTNINNSTNSFIYNTTTASTTTTIATIATIPEILSLSHNNNNISQNSVTSTAAVVTTAIGNYISYDETVQIQAYANIITNTITFEMTYTGDPTWISLGFSTTSTGDMIDSIAIIGQQQNQLLSQTHYKHSSKQTQNSNNNTNNNIQQYLMTSKELSGIVPIKKSSSSNTTSIFNKVFIQNNTHTYMKFSRPIIVNNPFLPDIYISTITKKNNNNNTTTTNNNNSKKNNILLYAYGYDNTFSYHIDRASFIFEVYADEDNTKNPASNTTTTTTGTLDNDIQSQPQNVIVVPTLTNTNTNTTGLLWFIHGVCMTIAWIILIPLGILSSRIRYTVLPIVGKGIWDWFQIHRLLNIIGVLLTIVGFIIGYIASNKSKSIFSNSHKKLGVYITTIVLVQAIAGIVRPKVVPVIATNTPEKVTKDEIGDTSDDDDDDDTSSSDERTTFIIEVTSTTKTTIHPDVQVVRGDNENEKVNNTYGSNNNSSNLMKDEKTVQVPAISISTSIQRLVWVYCHRIIGYVILLIAIYNCYTGTIRYDTKHNTHYTTIVIVFASIFYCPILLLIVLSKYSNTIQ